ncbi:hypothetical protein [Leuconostoc mesenteroides]|uniref:hypothetical protein n=1 Tax=Leuconostoc mesenteroides TaxID=1245 RepID=UPI000B9D60AA|nr:hypothetical protein [Leuconostoc mesenteroides]BAX73097.1 secretion chaperone CsaA [Leuconostoc mesenteroides]
MTYKAQLSDSAGETFFPNVVVDNITDIDKLVLNDEYSQFKSSQEITTSEQNEKIDQIAENSQLVANEVQDSKTSNSNWTNWSKDGMSLQNGAQIYSTDQDYPAFRTRVINGSTQVQIRFRIKNLAAGNDTSYVGFPASIQPYLSSQISLSFPSTNGITASWGFTNGAIQLHANTNNDFNAAYTYSFFATLEVN